jgi:hypothetical protein
MAEMPERADRPMKILDPHEANCLQTDAFVRWMIAVLCGLMLLLAVLAPIPAPTPEVIQALPGMDQK